MSEYASIKNLYKMDEATHTRGPENGFSLEAFGSITNWLVTEKVDGMNMRIIWEPGATDSVRIAGRSDKAQIPGDLLAYMQALVNEEALYEVFGGYIEEPGGVKTLVDCPEQVIFYGEGFGPGIQKAGAAYGGAKRFILFDVKVEGWWLDWNDMVDVAGKLGIETVPVLARGVTIEEAKAHVHTSKLLGGSWDAPHDHTEGFVARSEPTLYDKFGNHMIFKYKVRDLPR
jgi:hypothetical protein